MHSSLSTTVFSGVSLLALSDSCVTDDTNCPTQILKSDIQENELQLMSLV